MFKDSTLILVFFTVAFISHFPLTAVAGQVGETLAENMFVEVSGPGIYRTDGRNFGVFVPNGNSAAINIKPHPGWKLLSKSRMTATPDSSLPYSVASTDGESAATGMVVSINFDLQAWDLFHSGEPLSEQEENSIGAFVHRNVDNDDKSPELPGSPKRPGSDWLQTGEAVSGENDLYRLKCVFAPLPHIGTLYLSNYTYDGKIWKNPEKGAENLLLDHNTTKAWNLANPVARADFLSVSDKLYMEGGYGEKFSGGGVELFYVDTETSPSKNPFEARDPVDYHFICANCGTQPSIVLRRQYKECFPNLVDCEWSITAPASDQYNCLAWAVGLTNVNVLESLPRGSSFWNIPGIVELQKEDGTIVVRILNIDATFGTRYGEVDGKASFPEIDAFFAAHNRGRTTDPQSANIVYYRNSDGESHAARKKDCSCGYPVWRMFESKIGIQERIEHLWPQLESSDSAASKYGTAIRFYN